MKKVFNSPSLRGKVNFGWLKTIHFISFANYFNTKNIRFSDLRVLNDAANCSGKGLYPPPL